jgi:hypothetical protein
MALKLNRIGINAREFFCRFTAPFDIIRAFYKHLVKGVRMSILWGLFWISFALFAITTIKLLLIMK